MTRPKNERPRGLLKTNTADAGRYRHGRYHPAPALAPFVEHYWSIRWDLRGLAPERAETLPHPSVHLIFERHVGGQVAGVSSGRFSRLLEGEGGVIAAKFTPGGFRPFVNVNISTLTDKVVDAAIFFGQDAEIAERAILAAEDDETGIAHLEAFLLARRPIEDPEAARAAEIVYSVAGDRTIVKVEHLVDRHGMNVRTLQRLFGKYVGVSPKWVIQRYRLHEAAEQLAGGPEVNQAELAIALGYSDQAHFNRDFKSVVGTAPGEYARSGVRRQPHRETRKDD